MLETAERQGAGTISPQVVPPPRRPQREISAASKELTPTVFLIDDDAAVRRTIEALLRATGTKIQSFDSGEMFLRTYRVEQPGCLLLDMRMPTLNGLEVQERLAQLSYAPPVIMISGDADIPMAVEAMRRGALDFLKKPISWQPLHKAIEEGLRTDTFRRRQISEQLRLQQRLSTLTDKESAVLELLLEGLVNKQIAARFDLSTRTIELRRASIFRKLGVASMPEMMRLLYPPAQRVDRRDARPVRPPHHPGRIGSKSPR